MLSEAVSEVKILFRKGLVFGFKVAVGFVDHGVHALGDIGAVALSLVSALAECSEVSDECRKSVFSFHFDRLLFVLHIVFFCIGVFYYNRRFMSQKSLHYLFNLL